MHIQSRRTPRRLVMTRDRLIAPAVGLVLLSLGPASQAQAQGAIGPIPKSPAPAPVAPAPHVVTPPTLPPPIAAPAIANPLANQPHAPGLDDAKHSASDTGDQPSLTAVVTGRRQYEPLLHVPVTVANKTGGSPTRVVTDGNGSFDFGKLSPGSYSVDFPFNGTINGAVVNTGIVSATGGNQVSSTAAPISGTLTGDLSTKGGADTLGTGTNAPHPQAVLIALLLPAVQQARSDTVAVSVVHAVSAYRITNVRANLTIGKDGGVHSFDWGDGKGPVDLRNEATTIPLPKGTQPGDVRGTLTYTGATNVSGGTALAADRQHEPIIITKEFLTGVRVALGDVNGDGVPDFTVNKNGTFQIAKLAPGNYLLGIPDNVGPTSKDPFLISLLLPAVQQAREATVIEHRFPSADDALNISLRMGRDGRIMALNWGDGKGPVDFAKETKYIPLPQDPSPNELKLSLAPISSTATPRAVCNACQGTPVGLDHDPERGAIANVNADNHGNFTFGKLEPGNYALKLSGKDVITAAGPGGGPHNAPAVLIGLLLPAVSTASGNYVEHAFAGPSASSAIKITFRIGKDGRVMALDWGDGNGSIDPAKEARTLPLPQGAQPTAFSGMMSIFDRWGNL